MIQAILLSIPGDAKLELRAVKFGAFAHGATMKGLVGRY
jgi:hypothetical protein